MKPLTLSQSAEIAAFAETYARERFGQTVRVTVRSCKRRRVAVLLFKLLRKPKSASRRPAFR